LGSPLGEGQGCVCGNTIDYPEIYPESLNALVFSPKKEFITMRWQHYKADKIVPHTVLFGLSANNAGYLWLFYQQQKIL